MKKVILLLFAVSVFLVAGSAAADVITITLDGVDVSECGETWIESGVELSFVETTAEDCTEGSCYFGLGTDSVWLYPARLNLDLSGLAGTVTQVEVDIVDYCGVGCTAAFLYEGASTVDSAYNVGSAETLTLLSGGASVDRAAVSSCEGMVTEIRLEVAAVFGCIELQGEPLVGRKVILKQKDELNQKTKTDSDGCYKFESIVSGKKFKVIIKGPEVPE